MVVHLTCEGASGKKGGFDEAFKKFKDKVFITTMTWVNTVSVKSLGRRLMERMAAKPNKKISKIVDELCSEFRNNNPNFTTIRNRRDNMENITADNAGGERGPLYFFGDKDATFATVLGLERDSSLYELPTR